MAFIDASDLLTLTVKSPCRGLANRFLDQQRSLTVSLIPLSVNFITVSLSLTQLFPSCTD